MNTNIADTAAATTISKKELWALFVGMKIKHRLKIGDVECPDEMGGIFTPTDLLHAYGEFGELENLSELVAEIVSDDDDPLWALASRPPNHHGF